MISRPLGAVFVALIMTTAPSVSANEATRDAVLFLYNQGKDLLAAGKVHEACTRFEDGKRLDPSTINLLLRLGDCYEKLGRSASARREFEQAAAVARATGDAREGVALARARSLDSDLCFLTVEIGPLARVQGLVVTRDGAPILPEDLNHPIPVDPRVHNIEATAPGKVTWYGRADTSERRVQIVRILGLTDASLQPAAQSVANKGAPSSSLEYASKAGSPSFFRTLALGTGTVGLGALGAGAAFGVLAIVKSDASGPCDANSVCDPTGVRLRDEAMRARTASAVFLAAGTAAVGAGIVLFVLPTPASGKSRSAITGFAIAAAGVQGVGVRGTF